MFFKTFEDYCFSINESKKHTTSTSCVFGKVPDALANRIIRFGREKIPTKDLYVLETGHGRELDPHITILYGLHSQDPKEFESFLDHNKKVLKVKLGKISLFKTNDSFDVVKIEVISQDLININHKIKRTFTHTSSYPKYIPHITIAYVKKGKGDELDGSKKFLNTEFEIKELGFSNKNKKKIHFKIGA